jgi:Cysteine rich repeat
MTHRIGRFLGIAMFFAASMAMAQTGNPPASDTGPVDKIRAACGQDITKLCAGIQRGGGRILQCLQSHSGELSAACRTEVAARPAAKAAATPTAPSVQGAAQPSAVAAPAGDRAAKIANFKASCGSDAQTLCAGVPKEDHGVVKCLVTHRTELSATCKGYLAEVRAPRSAQKNSSSNNPAAAGSLTPAPPAADGTEKQ